MFGRGAIIACHLSHVSKRASELICSDSAMCSPRYAERVKFGVTWTLCRGIMIEEAHPAAGSHKPHRFIRKLRRKPLLSSSPFIPGKLFTLSKQVHPVRRAVHDCVETRPN